MAAAAEQRAGLSAEAVVVDTRPITLGAAVLPAAAPVMALEGQATPGLAGTLMQVLRTARAIAVVVSFAFALSAVAEMTPWRQYSASVADIGALRVRMSLWRVCAGVSIDTDFELLESNDDASSSDSSSSLNRMLTPQHRVLAARSLKKYFDDADIKELLDGIELCVTWDDTAFFNGFIEKQQFRRFKSQINAARGGTIVLAIASFFGSLLLFAPTCSPNVQVCGSPPTRTVAPLVLLVATLTGIIAVGSFAAFAIKLDTTILGVVDKELQLDGVPLRASASFVGGFGLVATALCMNFVAALWAGAEARGMLGRFGDRRVVQPPSEAATPAAAVPV